MKDVRQEFRYEHPVEEVFELISQGSFQLELIAHLGGRNAELVEAGGEAGARRVVTRQQTAVELPGFAKKLIPANSTVTQTYDWSAPEGGPRRGTWAASIKAAPISIGGTTELVPDGDGCIHRYGGQIKASVPVVGGKLESFALENLQRELARTHEFTAERLGG